jgi:cytochrome c peroxidase
VVEHYSTGGKLHPHKSDLIQPLRLTDKEKQQLLAFLTSLTDHTFITNEKHKK